MATLFSHYKLRPGATVGTKAWDHSSISQAKAKNLSSSVTVWLRIDGGVAQADGTDSLELAPSTTITLSPVTVANALSYIRDDGESEDGYIEIREEGTAPARGRGATPGRALYGSASWDDTEESGYTHRPDTMFADTGGINSNFTITPPDLHPLNNGTLPSQGLARALKAGGTVTGFGNITYADNTIHVSGLINPLTYLKNDTSYYALDLQDCIFSQQAYSILGRIGSKPSRKDYVFKRLQFQGNCKGPIINSSPETITADGDIVNTTVEDLQATQITVSGEIHGCYGLKLGSHVQYAVTDEPVVSIKNVWLRSPQLGPHDRMVAGHQVSQDDPGYFSDVIYLIINPRNASDTNFWPYSFRLENALLDGSCGSGLYIAATNDVTLTNVALWDTCQNARALTKLACAYTYPIYILAQAGTSITLTNVSVDGHAAVENTDYFVYRI